MLSTIIEQGSADTSVLDQLKNILADILQNPELAHMLTAESGLLGNLPELDSMAVITLITAFEEHFHIVVEDDDDLSDAFATLGSLTAYIEEKLATVK